jgi:hypothetical protein
MSVTSAEPVIYFTLTISEYERLWKVAMALETSPDLYAQRVLRDHMLLEGVKARRKARGKKLTHFSGTV